jgi:hypothetical protein
MDVLTNLENNETQNTEIEISENSEIEISQNDIEIINFCLEIKFQQQKLSDIIEEMEVQRLQNKKNISSSQGKFYIYLIIYFLNKQILILFYINRDDYSSRYEELL